MPTLETVLQNLGITPSWSTLRMELTLLLAELKDDPRYNDRVKRISGLLAAPQLPKLEQIYFVEK
jgi:hypothetical protein